MLRKMLALGLILICLSALCAGALFRPRSSVLPAPAYQGICELWQVDLFEGGKGSRASFLKSAAADFGAQNPGCLVLVRSLTGEEAVQNLAQGHLPDLISASAGLLSVFLPYLTPYAGGVSVRDEFAAAGTLNGDLLALPWAAGGYALFCREETLTAAGLSAADFAERPLDPTLAPADGRLLSAGAAACTDPYAALLTLGQRADPGPLLTQYEAYEAFLRGESGLLLGTQRDLVRLEARMEAGREGNIAFVPLSGYTDLVTAVGLVRGEGSGAVAAAFAEYLTGEEVQSALWKIGLFPVNGCQSASSGWAAQMEAALSRPLTLPGLFSDPAVIDQARREHLAALSA